MAFPSSPTLGQTHTEAGRTWTWDGYVWVFEGAVGPAPVLAVGAVTTGNPGTLAAVEINGTPPSYTLDFTIPRGEDGSGGGGSSNLDGGFF